MIDGNGLDKNEAGRSRKKILLGQLNSFGDCLFATTVARQIKNDYPGCHLTWAIGSMCRPILNGNPYVDDVWEIPLQHITEVAEVWPRFRREALARKDSGDFDEVFLTQIAPGNLQNYDGNIRSSIFRAYPQPITVPVAPVLELSSQEIENVRIFAETHCLVDETNVVLFECSPKSEQSLVNVDYAIDVAQKLVSNSLSMRVVLSSNVSVSTNDERIIDGSALSFRENAELTKYCTLFIGCSSGISWLCTSSYAKPLPMVQLINPEAQWCASFIQDFKCWDLSTEMIIEMSDCPAEKLVDCVDSIINRGFKHAKLSFHEDLPVSFGGFRVILTQLLNAGDFRKSFAFMKMYFKKYGLDRRLIFNIVSGLFHWSKNTARTYLSNLLQ